MRRNSIYFLGSGLALAAIAGGSILARLNEPIAPGPPGDPVEGSTSSAKLMQALQDQALAAVSREKTPAPPNDTAIIPEPRLEGGGKPFRDRFDRHRRDRWQVSHGWRNGKWTINDWRRSQARFGRGLTMTLEERLSSEADYAGAEVQTRKRFGHGYYEVHMRAARASGVVSAFFTYTGPPFGDPWNEIDVEILGQKPREVMFTYFRDGDKISHIHPLSFDASQDFHTYGFDWQPEHLRWYVDGQMVHEASAAELRFPNRTQKMMTSIWGSDRLTEWVGPFDKSSLPVSMEVACIAYAVDYPSRKPCEKAD